MYVVTVTFVIKPDCIGPFKTAIEVQARLSLEREADCVQFDVCADRVDPCRYFLYEIYTNDTAFKVHLESEHFKEFSAQIADWVDSKDVLTWVLIQGKAC